MATKRTPTAPRRSSRSTPESAASSSMRPPPPASTRDCGSGSRSRPIDLRGGGGPMIRIPPRPRGGDHGQRRDLPWLILDKAGVCARMGPSWSWPRTATGTSRGLGGVRAPPAGRPRSHHRARVVDRGGRPARRSSPKACAAPVLYVVLEGLVETSCRWRSHGRTPAPHRGAPQHDGPRPLPRRVLADRRALHLGGGALHGRRQALLPLARGVPQHRGRRRAGGQGDLPEPAPLPDLATARQGRGAGSVDDGLAR